MQEKMFEKESTLKLFIKFSVPSIIGMVVNAVYNLVDRIFIGNAPELGTVGLAAAALVYPVMMMSHALSLWVSNGASTLFSIFLGQKRKDQAEEVQMTAFVLAILVGLLIMVLGNIFMDPLLRLLGSSERVLPYAKDYLSIILFGSVFTFISMFGNNFSRAQGNPKNAMVSMLIGALFNIVFDYILIIKMGMGMKGAAYATVGGQLLSCIWQLAFLFSKRSIIPMVLKKIVFKLDKAKRILTGGLPIFLTQISSSAITLILNRQAFKYGGDMGLSTIAVLNSLQMLTQMPIIGFIQGQVPIVSYNYGARRYKQMIEVIKYSFIASLSFLGVAFLVIQFKTDATIKLFNSSPELLSTAMPAIKVGMLCLPTLGVHLASSNVFNATRQIKHASFLNLLRQVIILIPLVYLFAGKWGFMGIFTAMPVADFSAATIAFIFLLRLLKRFKNEFGMEQAK